jgi:CheY-like chemotaxis protein
MQEQAYHIIVADDDDDDQFIIKEAISEIHDRQIKVTSVYDGLQLLDYLKRHGSLGAEYQRPDLILLDINMPLLNGIDTLALMRETEGLREIPVCIISTVRDNEQRERCNALGAVDFYSKPNRIGAYKAILEELFHKVVYQTT